MKKWIEKASARIAGVITALLVTVALPLPMELVAPIVEVVVVAVMMAVYGAVHPWYESVALPFIKKHLPTVKSAVEKVEEVTDSE